MKFDYKPLQSLMNTKGYNQSGLALELKMNEGVLSQRFNNQRSFRQHEIVQICKILGIKQTDIWKYFFTPER